MVEKTVEPSDIEVIHAYIDYHRMALDNIGVLRRIEEAPWAVDFVSDLVYDDPNRCWRLLRGVAAERPKDDVMVSLGVTLGSLLRERPDMMTTIETEFVANNWLGGLMSYVMEDDYIRPDIWARIEEISSKN